MAAVTNVRVESNSISTTILRWTDNGGASNSIQRSTDGSNWTTIGTVAVDGTELYEDTFLDVDTKYWYRINNGSVSAEVTVWTHDCKRGSTQANTIAGNNMDDEQANAPMIGGSSPAYQDRCWACPSDGKLVLDCSAGCNAFQTVVTEDINSISVIGCGPCPPVDFIIPEGNTVGICGWPPGCDNVGDECFEGPITGPRTAKTNGLSYAGGPGGGTIDSCGCECGLGEASLWLALHCCEEDGDCTLRCDRTSSGKSVVSVKACGGVPPFRWELSGSGADRATIIPNQSQVEGDNRCIRVSLNGADEGGTREFVYGIQFTSFQYDCPSPPGNECEGYCSDTPSYWREKTVKMCGGEVVDENWCTGEIKVCNDYTSHLGTACDDIPQTTNAGACTVGVGGAIVPCEDECLSPCAALTPGLPYIVSLPVAFQGVTFSNPGVGSSLVQASAPVADGSCSGCDDADLELTVTDFAGVSATIVLGL